MIINQGFLCSSEIAGGQLVIALASARSSQFSPTADRQAGKNFPPGDLIAAATAYP